MLLAAVTLSAGCASQPAVEEPTSAEAGVAQLDRPLDSLALIDTAVRAGRLDRSTGLLYKVYVMFEPESLPQEYRSEVPSKCGTSLVSEVQRDWNQLTPEHRLEISQYIQPVTDVEKTDTQLDDVSRDRLDSDRESLE